MDVSVVIPTYNSELIIEKLVNKISLDTVSSYEIIVVNDKSKDNTFRKLKKIKNETPNLKIINLKENIGQVGATLVGVQNAKGEIIVTMDDDLQHNPKYIPIMIKKMEKFNCGCVVGSRNLISSRVKSLSLFRQSASFILIKFFNIFFGKKTIDPMSGFFLFKKKIYKKNKEKLFLKGFKILADLIYVEKNISVKDVIIKFDYRKKGESKLNFKILIILIHYIFFRIMNKN